MNEAEREAALEHLLSLEERDDVATHLWSDHGIADRRADHRELDMLHLAAHRRLVNERSARNPKCQAHDRPWSAPCICGTG